MNKLADVIAAMRGAAGQKEFRVQAWLELSGEHKALHDALHEVFKRRPTTQKFGLWLSENVGARHGELELVGRHSTHSKAWRYSVRADSDAAQVAAERAARQADYERRNPVPAFAIHVQAHEPSKAPKPAERAYVVTGKDANNEPVRHYLPPVQPAAPVVETHAAPASVTPKPSSVFPIWIQEGRPATRKEWWAHQRARLPRPGASFGMPDSDGNTTHMQANGVRAGAGSDPRTCYLAGSYGQYNWKKDYL